MCVRAVVSYHMYVSSVCKTVVVVLVVPKAKLELAGVPPPPSSLLPVPSIPPSFSLQLSRILSPSTEPPPPRTPLSLSSLSLGGLSCPPRKAHQSPQGISNTLLARTTVGAKPPLTHRHIKARHKRTLEKPLSLALRKYCVAVALSQPHESSVSLCQRPGVMSVITNCTEEECETLQWFMSGHLYLGRNPVWVKHL